MSKKIRVLVVDDSSTMRSLIRIGIEKDPRIKVVGEAASAKEARDRVRSLAPDVLTLDIEMPGMNGLDFLQRLMRARPTPVVMLSSVTAEGSEAAVKALSLGAVECILKPRLSVGQNPFENLSETLLMASEAQVAHRVGMRSVKRAIPEHHQRWNGKLVMIGASTGGVEALEFVLSCLPHDCPPILITQHMPEQFLVNFADRLNRLSNPTVRLAQNGDMPKVGEVLLAPGGEFHLVLTDELSPKVHLLQAPKRSGHRPSVDEMMLSAKHMAHRTVGVILTGMGHDGAEGIRVLNTNGADCYAQDQASSVVYGMPKMAFEKGGVRNILPLRKIPEAILKACAKV